ncbi:hypothetical protein PENTCL1PPCAC_10817, partial [Pristionchus entomophagus]
GAANNAKKKKKNHDHRICPNSPHNAVYCSCYLLDNHWQRRLVAPRSYNYVSRPLLRVEERTQEERVISWCHDAMLSSLFHLSFSSLHFLISVTVGTLSLIGQRLSLISSYLRSNQFYEPRPISPEPRPISAFVRRSIKTS